jgi:glyoxylase-like metal-dependent hydrolase (beta-lactamase superfamily II)
MQNSKPNSNKFSKLKKIFVVSLIIITILVGVLYYFLLVYNGSSSKEYTININDIRNISNSQQGTKPTKIQYEALGNSKNNLALSVAGGDWSQVNDAMISYNIVYPDNSIVVDTAYSSETVEGKGSTQDIEAYSRIKTAMDKSKFVIPTHEHSDHFGGILAYPNWNEYLKKSLITTEQYQNTSNLQPVTWPTGSRNGFVPLYYEKYYYVSPGVVLIKAPGHTTGSQMVYIQLQNGKEIILLGDVTWRHEGVERENAHSYVSSLLLGEDREATLGQIKALNTLKKSTPTIEFIAGHDADDLAKLDSKGVIFNKFN